MADPDPKTGFDIVSILVSAAPLLLSARALQVVSHFRQTKHKSDQRSVRFQRAVADPLSKQFIELMPARKKLLEIISGRLEYEEVKMQAELINVDLAEGLASTAIAANYADNSNTTDTYDYLDLVTEYSDPCLTACNELLASTDIGEAMANAKRVLTAIQNLERVTQRQIENDEMKFEKIESTPLLYPLAK